MAALKLLTEIPLQESFEYIIEEKNNKEPSSLYVKGPYIGAEDVNKNKRRYGIDEVVSEVNRFDREMIKTGRSMGELNHPASAEINPERACHMIVELKQEGNVFIGKSKILSTPMGHLVKCLINDGVRVGMSTRALGKLIEEGSGVNRVRDMRLITVDCVADPSFTKAFVSNDWTNGVLESRQYVLNSDGSYEEIYDKFDKALSILPKHDVEEYLKESIIKFITSLKGK